MEFQTLIENRRSVRKYSSHTNVTKEQIQQLVQAALEAPSWKNTETGRYYCVLSADMSQKLRKECLCYANNDVKTEHAALIVTTFVHNRAGFQTDGTPIMRLEMDGAVTTLVFRTKT
ncbi:MAG: nitroreductase family protein [Blautia faecis]